VHNFTLNVCMFVSVFEQLFSSFNLYWSRRNFETQGDTSFLC